MPTKKTDVPLDLFSGTNSELRPVDIPEGISPDNQDVIFVPGSADSRPGTHNIFSDVLLNSPTIVYEKTFVQPNGLPLTLLLDSNGILYKEDVFGAPGVRTQIGSAAAGARAFSVTGEGAEYITFHDGEHGVDVARQLNNGFLDRISQDGPAAAISVADLGAQVSIVNPTGIVPEFATVVISAALENGNVVTITTATPHGLFQQEQISVQGVAGAYSGIFSVLDVPDQFTFTYTNPTAGLAAQGAAGTVRPTSIQVTTTAPHGMIAGDQFTIAGTSTAGYNNNVAGNPVFWNVQAVISPTVFIFVAGINPANSNGGTINEGGIISPGVHQICCSFLLRSGFITKPGPISNWFAAGGRQALASGLPIGPSNVVGRILFPTGSGGDNFFWIKADVAGGARATLIPNNTDTSAILDFSDPTLFGEIAIDIPGNNLFALHTLAPCLGVFFYGSRLVAWGEFNKEDRFLNMGFEGGTAAVGGTVPLGWNAGAGGALVASPSDTGMAWQISGNGGTDRGQITQAAYQDEFFQPKIKANTNYTFWLWAQASAAGLAGAVVASLFSASTGFHAIASINISAIPAGSGDFVNAPFSLITPAVIPADLILFIQADNLPNGQTVTIDEMMMVFTAQPYRETQFRISYPNNFESFDGITGVLGSTEDSAPIRCAGSLRGTMYFQTTERLHQTRDNGVTGPEGWAVDEVAAVGAMSVDAMGPAAKGEDWMFTVSGGASGSGLYVFDGGTPRKCSQEYQTFFNGINPAAKQNVWLVNDPVDRRVYIATPQGAAPFPNLLLVMDYRELDGQGDIAGHPPIHISLTGKMVASDLVRKWTRWNLTLNCGALLTRQDGSVKFVVGAGNGQALGAAPGFGNCYYFDPAKLTDDDFGQISPYYFTYFFVNHEMEQQLQFGSHRKSYSYLTARILGVGNVIITPYVNEMTNALRSLRAAQLTSTLVRDLERTLQFSGERAAFKVAVIPLSGHTDVQMSIQKLVITMKEETMIPVQGPR